MQGATPDDATAEVDVRALFERLKEEVARGGGAHVEIRDPDVRARQLARSQAERLWPVTADRTLLSRPGLRGAVARPLKKVLKKLMRWYVEPVAMDQKGFNDAALKLIDDLQEQVDALKARVAELEGGAGARGAAPGPGGGHSRDAPTRRGHPFSYHALQLRPWPPGSWPAALCLPPAAPEGGPRREPVPRWRCRTTTWRCQIPTSRTGWS